MYKTKDLYLATALVAKGHKVLNGANQEGQTIFWSFEDNDILRQSVEEYLSGQMILPVRDVFGAQRILHSFFNLKNNGRQNSEI